MTTAPLTPTRTNWTAAIEGGLLLNTGAVLLAKAWYGQLPLYIHPRYMPLTMVTAVLLFVIGAARLWQIGDPPAESKRPRNVYALLLAPVLLGVLVPVKPAGSALVDPSQLNNVGKRTGQTPQVSANTTQWTLLDWLYARYTLPADAVKGKPVDVVGFVYRNADTPADELHVIRYTLACCVADRSGVALPVRWPNAQTLPNDQWIRVTGTIDLREANGPPELFIADANVEPVEQPAEPYLYP